MEIAVKRGEDHGGLFLAENEAQAQCTLNDEFKNLGKAVAYQKGWHEYERRLRLAVKLLSQSQHSSSRFPDVPHRDRS